ncbi:MAG: translocase FtsK protein [Candidatus Magasanikbacteria bacterium GW2011_GWA2_45_39]|uniref:Translocase FtsK protein n=2 Tax=Candidatus Magasanikiibacteriota TaxID=1752731 RepID=A0A0G1MWV4_9BACT|nr:MAG: translocase FtsK protein [Candidatus Magasanikbacteria bacterium GW2011_GWA2_45_39]KKU12821.1 MAG: translocase FtsK protein [Candidatus Magasanikbacteria bacterium GW2011_GWC2_45_8]
MVATFIFSLILILSYFHLGGRAGPWLDGMLAELFGASRLIVPIILAYSAFTLEFQKDGVRSATRVIALVLLLIAVNGLMHLSAGAEDLWTLARMGGGGGLLGYSIAYPLVSLFSIWVALILLGGMGIIGLIFLFNTSLNSLMSWPRRAMSGFLLSWQNIKYKSTADARNENGGVVFGGQEVRAAALDDENADDEEKGDRTATQKEPVIVTSRSVLMSPTTVSSKEYRKDLPRLSLLHSSKSEPTSGDIKGNLYTIKKTFESFGIQVEMGEVRVGPTVTQYSLKPAEGVKLSRITALHNNLAYALAAHPIRIEAPIPGQSLVGIEVPNQKVAMVSLRELLEASEYRGKGAELAIALGKDVSGKPYVADLNKLPHLLVAGATGSGKTVCINALILSLLFQHTPRTLRFIMVDPKRVELPLYNGIPHLLTPVITDTQKTVNALKWTIGEMERRFEILSKVGKRDIWSYNKIMEEKMPYVVFIVDELADLMSTAGPEIEGGIIRLAQMARAVGIHLVLATQRPSVDVITGLIKANIPARIAFSVASQMDSRTILDTSGAEKLLGRGDMLWSPPDMSHSKRLQGAFVSEEDIKAVVRYYKEDDAPHYIDEVTARQQGAMVFGGSSDTSADDPLYNDAKEVIMQAGKGSASLLQRRLKVGYARAARLLDILEEKGVIGPGDGAKPREVLIGKHNFDTIPTPDSGAEDEPSKQQESAEEPLAETEEESGENSNEGLDVSYTGHGDEEDEDTSL